MVIQLCFKEEEMKRFQEVMAEDGYYNSVSFSYQVNSCPDHNQWQPEQNAQTVSEGSTDINNLLLGYLVESCMI